MTKYYDALETRDSEVRERAQLSQLQRQIAHAKRHTPAYARLLADTDPTAITTREALATIPITRKSDLLELQRSDHPFGGFAATRRGRAARIFASPGPLYEPESRGRDYWRLARSLFAAGFRAGDLIHNCYSYHFTPAGSMMETGAHALGCTVFAAGTGQTESQVRVIADLHPDGYVGTPSFLKMIVDKADEMGIALSGMRKALVSGEAFPSELRDQLIARGIGAYQAYATADVGAIAFETEARDGLVVDEGALVEVVQPGMSAPVAPGEVGEVVVTSLSNADYPLIRFATGDLSAVLPGKSPCGRTNMRIKGWLGRADQSAKVRGMFVHPCQVVSIMRRHPEIGKARLVVSSINGADHMNLDVELKSGMRLNAEAIVASIREITTLRGAVTSRSGGEIPDDGRVIDDIRKQDR
jgi:phenylacetate-CoA ligase